MVFGSFGVVAEEKVFLCKFKNQVIELEHTLIIHTDAKYLRLNNDKYDKDYIDTDLYIEASITNPKELGNGRIRFNKITGEIRIEQPINNSLLRCKETSKLIP